MAIVATTAIGLLREALLLGATAPMILLGPRSLLSCLRIDIDGTEFLPTLPAPGATTAGADLKSSSRFEPASKDIVAGGIL